MKKISLLSSLFLSIILMSAIGITSALTVGAEAPSFNLKNIDGKMISLNDVGAEGAIVIFSCNHCPYAKAYEDRIIALNDKYKTTYPVVMINSNDANSYPADSFENMIKRADKKGFTFPYLYDETQEIAKAYGALKTPHVYLLHKEDGKNIVKYIGAIDDNTYSEKKVKEHYLEEAITSLQNGEAIKVTETKAIGCGIKWK